MEDVFYHLGGGGQSDPVEATARTLWGRAAEVRCPVRHGPGLEVP